MWGCVLPPFRHVYASNPPKLNACVCERGSERRIERIKKREKKRGFGWITEISKTYMDRICVKTEEEEQQQQEQKKAFKII